ncbi:hypothetical protein K488DRAFT_83904 [Vararia minispora EC-137]|uniref:Uncharacterized protein n=1 Tax=Vararia minispora EC-137 TaxID=1314806 RepID=A0ACB8QRN9_9AGAM|nr:hypothetical protein K488DRAFT_83904 [Vararia minispora EC-137]
MKFTTTTACLVWVAALSAVCATPFSAPDADALTLLAARDVWSPKVTTPHHGTVWRAGGTYAVEWSTANPPDHVSNRASIALRKGDRTMEGKRVHAGSLAEGFDLHTGHQDITLPEDLVAGDDYRIVLFGDSGNWSPPFTIAADHKA